MTTTTTTLTTLTTAAAAAVTEERKRKKNEEEEKDEEEEDGEEDEDEEEEEEEKEEEEEEEPSEQEVVADKGADAATLSAVAAKATRARTQLLRHSTPRCSTTTFRSRSRPRTVSVPWASSCRKPLQPAVVAIAAATRLRSASLRCEGGLAVGWRVR